jgi:glycine cleavage system aminomethyltransferase T
MSLLETQTFDQGPKSAEVLQKITSYDVPSLLFGRSAYMDIAGIQCHVARGGYTGEDGFEVRCSHNEPKLAVNPMVHRSRFHQSTQPT